MDIQQMRSNFQLGLGVAVIPPTISSAIVLTRYILLDVIANVVVRIFTANKYKVSSIDGNFLINIPFTLKLTKISVIIGGTIIAASFIAYVITEIYNRTLKRSQNNF